MDDINALLEPGQIVENPQNPEWGQGQVQSNIGGKVTVNFSEVGKVVIESHVVTLRPVFQQYNQR